MTSKAFANREDLPSPAPHVTDPGLSAGTMRSEMVVDEATVAAARARVRARLRAAGLL